MKSFVLLLLALVALASPAHAISIPIGGTATPAPECTVAQLAAHTGNCSAVVNSAGNYAIVTDATGASCTTGGGAARVVCTYSTALAAWVPEQGLTNPLTASISAGAFNITNIGSLDFFINPCVGLTNGRLTSSIAGLVSCVEDLTSSGPLSAADMRTSFTNIEVVDVDPAAGGSTSAGLQEAITACNSAAGRCIVQLRADTTYTIPARSTWSGGDAGCNAETNGADDVWIRGYGDGSVISFTDDTSALGVGEYARLICIETGSLRIHLSDFRIARSETCTTGCDANGHANIWFSGNVQDLEINNVTTYSTEAATSDTSTASIYNLYAIQDNSTTPDVMPTRVSIHNNRIGVSGRGVQMIACDFCSITNNDFIANFPVDSTSPPSFALMAVYEGAGVLVNGNRFDMRRDGDTSVTYSGAILLHSDQDDTTTINGVNRTAVVTGNTVIGLRHTSQIAVWMIGYSNAVIASNEFEAGVCTGTTTSCSVVEDCAAFGGTTCDPVGSWGVYFDYSNGSSSARNQGNLIASNVFSGFQEIDTVSDRCPIAFDSTGGTHAGSNTQNRVVGNLFWLNNTTDDGICGDPAKIALNSISENYTVGATTDSIAGVGQLTYNRSTEEVTAQELFATERFGIPHSITVPGSCATLGELYQDDDAPDGQQLYACKGGVFVLQSGAGGGISTVGSCSGPTCYTSVSANQVLAGPSSGSAAAAAMRALVDADGPWCRSDGTNCPAAGGSASTAEPFVTTAASASLSNEKVATDASNGIDMTINTAPDPDTITYSVDMTELTTGFTVGNDTGLPVVITMDTLGVVDTTLTASGTGFEVTTLNSIKLHANAIGTFEVDGPVGNAGTLLPTDAIGSSEIGADQVGASEIAADAVGSSEIAADAVGTSEIAANSVGDAEAAWTENECFPLYAPSAEIQNTDDVTSVFRASYAIVITSVWCETDTGTVTMDIQIDDGTPADVMGTDLVCDTNGEVDVAGLTGSMAAGDRLDFAITSVASNPKRITVCIDYTR